MKKLLLFMIMLFGVIGLSIISPESSMSVQAEEVQEEAGNFKYKMLEDGTVEITDFIGSDGITEVAIPDEIDGKSVTSIGSSVFSGCSNISSIIIPESVTSIDEWAFSGTAWLRNEQAKNPLVIVNGILYDGSTATGEVSIPEGVTSIGKGAFRECRSITSVTIPKGVTSIGWSAFINCSNLSSITIPEGVTDIGPHAFNGCSKLNNIAIPKTVTNIEYHAFDETAWLKNEREKNPLVVVNGMLIDGRTANGDVIIPNGVTSIGTVAFEYCSSINSITIPNSVVSIASGAFQGCSGISSIIIPDSVTSIEECVFQGCSSIGTITVPDNVTFIGIQAFCECSNLSSITIPKSVTTIERSAFYGCSKLKDVSYNGTKEEWKAIVIGEDNDYLLKAIGYNSTSAPEQSENNSGTNKNENITTALGKITVSKTSVTCTGKSLKPAVTVTDANGQKVNASNYTVTYTDNKKVGQATVTVTGKGNYTGTLKATFKILPKGTTLSKVTAKKKAIAVKWKKQTKEVTGYQIQYSTRKKFKSANITTIKNNKTTSTTIKKLKANKKYYVRIRTYKTVKINNKSTKLYSKWSNAKNVKTKK